MKTYLLGFKTKKGFDLFAGTADQVVNKMRSECHTPSLTDREYRNDFARRHNYFFRPKIHGLTNTIFVESLGDSTITALNIRLHGADKIKYNRKDITNYLKMSIAELLVFYTWYSNQGIGNDEDWDNIEILKNAIIRSFRVK